MDRWGQFWKGGANIPQTAWVKIPSVHVLQTLIELDRKYLAHPNNRLLEYFKSKPNFQRFLLQQPDFFVSDHEIRYLPDDLMLEFGDCLDSKMCALYCHKPETLEHFVVQKHVDLNTISSPTSSLRLQWNHCDMKKFEKMLELGLDVNQQDPLTGKTFLFFTVSKYIPMLLDHGADVNIETEEGETCMFRILKTPELKMSLLKRLISLDNNINRVFRGKTYLHFCRDVYFLNFLMSSGVRVQQGENNPIYQAETMPQLKTFLPFVEKPWELDIHKFSERLDRSVLHNIGVKINTDPNKTCPGYWKKCETCRWASWSNQWYALQSIQHIAKLSDELIFHISDYVGIICDNPKYPRIYSIRKNNKKRTLKILETQRKRRKVSSS